MIIICVQDESLGASENVINQYKQFLRKGNTDAKTDPLVIPIPITRYAAKKIYSEVDFINSNIYQTYQDTFERLKECTLPEEIGKLVMNMILIHTKEPNSQTTMFSIT